MQKYNNIDSLLERVEAQEPDSQIILFNYTLYKNKKEIYQNRLLLGMLKYILVLDDRSDYENELGKLLEIYEGGINNVL